MRTIKYITLRTIYVIDISRGQQPNWIGFESYFGKLDWIKFPIQKSDTDLWTYLDGLA